MAWGLEARVPFLDKKFLEVVMNIDAKYKMFSKGTAQEMDQDGKPKMEKVISARLSILRILTNVPFSISYEKRLTAPQRVRPIYLIRFSGVRRNR
jgi:asparagine synthetase B (glutamine-hydrolysing)